MASSVRRGPRPIADDDFVLQCVQSCLDELRLLVAALPATSRERQAAPVLHQHARSIADGTTAPTAPQRQVRH